MKISILAIALVSSMTASAFIGPVNRSTNLEYDGTIKNGTLEKHFMNVINNQGATLAVGTAVALDVVTDDGASVVTTATSGMSPLCIMAVSCADNALCECQTYGIFDAALFDSTAAASVAGKRFYMSTNNAGYISARGTEAATEVSGGVFYDVASASGTVQVFINLK